MKAEDHLDLLIERGDYQGDLQARSNPEIEASLVAAEALTHLQNISVPPELARRLERSIREHARSQKVHQQKIRNAPGSLIRSSAKLPLPLSRHAQIAVAVVAICVVICTSLMTVFARSLPGGSPSLLTPTKDPFAITAHDTPQSPAHVEMEQLHQALLDLNTAVKTHQDENTIKQAFSMVALKTKDSQRVVANLPAGADQDTAQQQLQSALAEEKQILRTLLSQVSWSFKVKFTQQLESIGDSVPKIIRGEVHIQANGMLRITLIGTSFASQVKLIVDGQVRDATIQNTSEQLVATISNTNEHTGTWVFGVLNPDGTAAQILLNANRFEREDDQKISGMPTPQSTREPIGN